MRKSCIKAIIRKDAISAYRNKLVLMALVSGILFSFIYYALPSTVDQTIEIGISGGDGSEMLKYIASGMDGVALTSYASEDLLIEGIENGDEMVGIALPEDFFSLLSQGKRPEAVAYIKSDVSSEARETFVQIIETMFDYIAYGENALPFEVITLGEEAADAIPLRQRSIPLYLIMALMMEMWTISTLIVEEGASGTIRAILVSPASPSDVIAAKGIVGGSYSLFVVAVILILTQSLRGSMAAMVIILLLGALLAVSLGLLLGSLTTSITGSYIYVSVPLIILMLPALFIFFPDMSIPAVKAIPTYYLVKVIDSVLNAGAGIATVAKDIAIVAVTDAVFFILGVISLRRRYS